MRRTNLLFFGITDSFNEQWKESEQKVLSLCETNLDLKLDPSCVERAHRIGNFTSTKQRPIIVKFAHFKTKERILGCGRKLKGTDFAIREDFASSTRFARSKLLAFVRPLKCAFKLSLDKLYVGSKCYFYDSASNSVIEHTTLHRAANNVTSPDSVPDNTE